MSWIFGRTVRHSLFVELKKIKSRYARYDGDHFSPAAASICLIHSSAL